MTVPEAPAGFRSGFVAVIGRPNVGKSTLVNRIVGEKVAITSPTAQTTRNRLRGILTRPESQLILVDTPGIHKPHHKLGQVLVHNARSTVGGVDGVLFVVDGSVPAGTGDAYIAQGLTGLTTPLWLVLNKLDRRSANQENEIQRSYAALIAHPTCTFEVSAEKGTHVTELIEAVSAQLPEGPYYYPPDLYTDQPERFIIGELIREQVLMHTREEIPHSVAVVVERVEEGETLTRILATVLIERNSQKRIIIGSGGSMLKQIGSGARQQMQKLLDGKVYLELFVKVKENWRQSEGALRELGYRRED